MYEDINILGKRYILFCSCLRDKTRPAVAININRIVGYSCAHFFFLIQYDTRKTFFQSQSFRVMSAEEPNANNNTQNLGNKVQPAAASPAEIQQFTSYLLRVVPLATDLNSTNEFDEFKRALNEKNSATDGIRRFLSDPQCVVFFIRVIQQGKGKNQRE